MLWFPLWQYDILTLQGKLPQYQILQKIEWILKFNGFLKKQIN